MSRQHLAPSIAVDYFDKFVLVTRADGVGYYGRLTEIMSWGIELTNNGMTQRILFDKIRWSIEEVQISNAKIPTLGERRLPLGDK